MTRWHWGWLLAGLLIGCDDGGSGGSGGAGGAGGAGGEGPDQGVGCTDTCLVGSRQCGPEGQVQICADLDGDGCSEWGGDVECPPGSGCIEGACEALCRDGCTAGEAVCGAGGRRLCEDTDGDGCVELGPATACGAGERCDGGACVPEGRACEDACPTDGLRACVEGGYRRCGQFDEDPCLDWSPGTPCEAGSTCQGEGECVPDCVDACDAGTVRCEGDGFVTCGNSDADLCLEWGPVIACRPDERCDDGACVPAEAPCDDTCEADGTLACDADGVSFRRCGQYDADACRELSARVPCAGFERCEAGACVPVCADACEVGAARCGAGGVEICGNFNADPCLEFGPALPCGADERCDDGRCVVLEQPCVDACEAGALRCAGDGVQVCADQDDDPCTEWSATVPCGAGERCEGDGQCVPDCVDECAAGATRCEGGQVSSCADHDADGCLEFGAALACPEGQSCSNGQCRIDCVDDCAANATDCVPEGVRRCGQFDADACRDWSGPTPCGAAEACMGGACVAICQDECRVGDRRCLGEGFEICGDFDGDPCLEYGGGAACGAGFACEAGACQIQCDDLCAEGDTRCVDPGRRQTCGNFNADPCLEWSGPEACGLAEACSQDDCVERPAPVGLVINELVYDIEGADAPGVFVELYGPAGTDLAGVELVGVNGSNGADYARIALQGQVPADGYFVVAHVDAAPALAAVADQRDRAVDFQNGPDSVQLRFGARVLDAVAYGVFGPGEFAAGEGEPAVEPALDAALSRDEAHRDTQNNVNDFNSLPPSPGAARACVDACVQDELRCAGDTVERCGRQAGACTAWAQVADCAAEAGRCADGACQGVEQCVTPGVVVGAFRPLAGLQANFTCLDARPRPGGGFALVTGNPGDGVDFGLIDGDFAFTAGPVGLGHTHFAQWGNSAASVYYPSLTETADQYAVTWSLFSDQGNRDIAFRRITQAGQVVPQNNIVISAGVKGFSPVVRPGGRGFIVLFNAYRQLKRIDLDELGTVIGNQTDVGVAHGDTREQFFLGWADGGDDALLAYAANTVDFADPRFFLQPVTAAGANQGNRIDLGPAMVTSGNRNAFLFRLGGGRYGVFWRQRLADAGRTEALNYAVVSRAGVVERRVELNELDRPAVYKPHMRPESIVFDGQRFAVYHERFFPDLEPNHYVIQWMTPDGLPIERDDLANTGHGVLSLHPETGWHLIKSGSPISIARLGCE